MPLVLANIFQPLIDVFEQVLLFFHDTIGFGWGFSIVFLTIIVRALLLPLTIKQFKSMRALQILAPEIKKLQNKYKDDKQRLNQEMMKFYQENKVNPFGSCLPIVAQLPVFLSLFYMLQKDLRQDICGQTAQACGKLADSAWTTGVVGDEKFLFIPDITDKATGGVLIALIVMYVGSQLVSSLLMSVTADRNQRMIMIALPFVFVIFILNFPAGLIVYWITTNVWTIGQQAIVRRTLGPPPDTRAAMAEANAVQPVAAGGTSVAGAAPPPPPRKKKKKTGRRK
ncbi:MAG: YidC/Oxa1 family membrane protein insertase [Baekduiaceae bacterium]